MSVNNRPWREVNLLQERKQRVSGNGGALRNLKEVKRSRRLESNRLREGVWALPETADQAQELLDWFKTPQIKKNNDLIDSSNKRDNEEYLSVYPPSLGDDGLYDTMDTAKEGTDLRPIVQNYIKRIIPPKSSGNKEVRDILLQAVSYPLDDEVMQ